MGNRDVIVLKTAGIHQPALLVPLVQVMWLSYPERQTVRMTLIAVRDDRVFSMRSMGVN
jgi:hypothetical protein